MDAKRNDNLHKTEDEETLYSHLIRNLDQEIIIQQSLLQVLDEELSVLMSVNMGGIEETNNRKEMLLQDTKENSSARQSLLEQLKKAFGLGRDQQVTMSLCEDRIAGKSMAGRLKSCRQTLISLAEQVQANNQRNQDAIQAALENVHGSLHFLKTMLFPAANYQKTGQYSQNHAQGAFIIREG